MIRKLLVLVSLILLSMKVYTEWDFLKKDWLSWIMINVIVLLLIIAIIGLFCKMHLLLNVIIPFIIFFGGGGLLTFPWVKSMMINHSISIALLFTLVYITFVRFRRLQILRLVAGAMVGVVLLAPFWLVRNNYFQKHPQYKKHAIL